MGLPSMVLLTVGLVLVVAATSLVLVTERLNARQWKLELIMRNTAVLVATVALALLLLGAIFAIYRVLI